MGLTLQAGGLEALKLHLITWLYISELDPIQEGTMIIWGLYRDYRIIWGLYRDYRIHIGVISGL